MKIRLVPVLVFVLSILPAATVYAAPIDYRIWVNTSVIQGDTGSLEFQFDPGLLSTQSATAQVSNFQIFKFASDGSLEGGCPCSVGDVSGQLPGTVTFDNGTAFNDYLEPFNFGEAFSFDLSLSGPALTAPDGTSLSGSVFALSLYLDPAGTGATLTSDPDGFAVTVDVNPDGTTTPTLISEEARITTLATTPEPSSLALVSSGIAAFAWLFLRRQTSARNTDC